MKKVYFALFHSTTSSLLAPAACEEAEGAVGGVKAALMSEPRSDFV